MVAVSGARHKKAEESRKGNVMNELDIHRGVVERWLREPDNKGFGILLLDRRRVSYIGRFAAGIREGDTVAFLVRSTDHPKYGQQFNVQKTVMHLPCAWNLVGWLLQRLPHIGPVRARQIQEQFGENLWDTLEEDPSVLTQIAGITEERALQVMRAYKQERETIEVYMRLIKLGVDTKIVMALVRKDLPYLTLQYYLDTDPYRLLEFEGVTFKHCDEIAGRLGISKDDTRRIRGFLVHLLREARGDGHTIVHINRVKQEMRSVLSVAEARMFEAINPTDEEVQAAALPAKDGAMAHPLQYVFFGKYIQWRELAKHDAAIIEILGHKTTRAALPADGE